MTEQSPDPNTPQWQLIRDTGNGPTESIEEEVLRAEFGAPDANGVYGAPTAQEEAK